MTGILEPAKALAQSPIAVNCGIPAPDTIRVVQIEPGPTPTFTASTPALTKSLAAWAVAIFPAMMSSCGWAFSDHLNRIEHCLGMPMRGIHHDDVHLAFTSKATRSDVSGPTPNAAPTCKRPWASYEHWDI